MKQLKSEILAIKARGTYEGKNYTVSGAKCELYLEDDNIFLMSHNAKWNRIEADEALQPKKMHSWKSYAFICKAKKMHESLTINDIGFYNAEINQALGITIESYDFYEVKKDDAPLKKDDAPLQPAPDADDAVKDDAVKDDAVKDDAPLKPAPDADDAVKDDAVKDDAPLKPLKKDDAPLKKDDAVQPLKGLQGAALQGDMMQKMQMFMQMFMQPAGVSEEALQMIQDLKNQNEALCKALDAYKVRIEALENNAPSRVIHEFRFNGEVKKIEGEIYHQMFDIILKTIILGIPCYLFGPAGSGKNVIAEQIAKALGLDFYYSNAVTQEFKVTGHSDINGNLVETEFYKAFTKGGVFMLDEVDASDPNALIVLNAALANGYFDFPVVGRKMMHENFKCIAAGNTKGTGATMQYSSRFIIDEATRDRFDFFEIDYDANVEKSIIKEYDADEDIITFAHDVRKSAEKNNISVISGYRLIKYLAKKQQAGFSVKDSIKASFFNKYNADDVRIIAGDLITYNNKYTEALKRLAA